MIPRWKAIVGMVAGVMLLLSGCAHSLLGWPELRIQLSLAQNTVDLTQGLQVAWHLGGMAMLAFSAIVLPLFIAAWKRKDVSLQPALVIGVFYLVFGIWAMLKIETNPFYLVFVIPGALLVAAGWPRK